MCFPDCDHSRKTPPPPELPVHICLLPGDETLCGLAGCGGTMPIYVTESSLFDTYESLEQKSAREDSTCDSCKRELQVLTC